MKLERQGSFELLKLDTYDILNLEIAIGLKI